MYLYWYLRIIARLFHFTDGHLGILKHKDKREVRTWEESVSIAQCCKSGFRKAKVYPTKRWWRGGGMFFRAGYFFWMACGISRSMEVLHGGNISEYRPGCNTGKALLFRSDVISTYRTALHLRCKRTNLSLLMKLANTKAANCLIPPAHSATQCTPKCTLGKTSRKMASSNIELFLGESSYTLYIVIFLCVCVSSPLWLRLRMEGHTRLRERGWGGGVLIPIRTRGQTLWYSRYIRTLWGIDSDTNHFISTVHTSSTTAYGCEQIFSHLFLKAEHWAFS